MNDFLRSLFLQFCYRTGFLVRTIFNRYPYMHEPWQLRFLLQCLEDTAQVPGRCLEIGCAYGATTILLNKHLQHLGDRRAYTAIDTFAGFVPSDADYEIGTRKKDPRLKSLFRDNQKAWVELSLQLAGVVQAKLIQADCASFDYRPLGAISFCLLDVDLYQPVKAALARVYPALSPGGVIVVDDCAEHDLWDGALQAYQEFVAEQKLPSRLCFGKYGVIIKPAA